MLTRRLQVLLDEDRWSRLQREADRRRVPVATLVREAIDELFPADREVRQAALQAILDAEVMDVPDPGALREELHTLRDDKPW
ncbi:MAG: antitoxin [Actinobacteria bacterium]|nr:antitoxin [Actinomycetota bacterium]